MEEAQGENKGLLPGCMTCQTGPIVRTYEKKLRLRPINRNQMILHPVDVERLVPEDHEVRAVWELVGSLDLSPYYERYRFS